MRFTQITKEQKLTLLKSTEINKKIKDINKELKDLLRSKGIKSLRKFNSFQELQNHLYPQVVRINVHDILEEFIKKTYTNPKTKTWYINAINKIHDYIGGFDNQLMDFIKQNYTISSQIKILNVLVNYFKNDKSKHQYWYDHRDKIYKEYINKDKSEVFNGNKKEDYEKILNKMENNNYKLVFSLMINHPSLRVSDYHTLKIRNYNEKDNYIKNDFKQVIFNDLVKVKSKKIIIDLLPDEQKLFKEVIENIKGDLLFSNKLDTYQKNMVRISKREFKLIPHDFRKLHYQDVSEDFKKEFNRVKSISDGQNHSIQIGMSYYH